MFEKVVEVLFKKDRNGEFEMPAEQQDDMLNRSDYSNQDNRRKEGCC
jgi:hypothetical protein